MTSLSFPASSLSCRTAEICDAPAIAALVNRAYRPGAGVAGWTHEGHLVDGPRTTAMQVAELFGEGSCVRVLCRDDFTIVACVHIQAADGGAYIGMLATDPDLQAQGLGKQLLAHAEAYAAEHLGATRFYLSVLSSRPELLAFYQRRGYVLTGESDEYPLSAGVGQPRVTGLKVLSLSKKY